MNIKKENLATPADEQASANTPKATRGTDFNNSISKGSEDVNTLSENSSEKIKKVKERTFGAVFWIATSIN